MKKKALIPGPSGFLVSSSDFRRNKWECVVEMGQNEGRNRTHREDPGRGLFPFVFVLYMQDFSSNMEVWGAAWRDYDAIPGTAISSSIHQNVM